MLKFKKIVPAQMSVLFKKFIVNDVLMMLMIIIISSICNININSIIINPDLGVEGEI